MPVETATTINQLDATKPGINDLKSEGDDHIRLVKSTIKATFPNVTGVVTPTHDQLNFVAGVTSPIQAQIAAAVAVAVPAAVAVGAYALVSPPVNVSLNGTVGGSSIFLAGGTATGWAASSVQLLGTWKCMGGSGPSGRVSAGEYGLFQRIA